MTEQDTESCSQIGGGLRPQGREIEDGGEWTWWSRPDNAADVRERRHRLSFRGPNVVASFQGIAPQLGGP